MSTSTFPATTKAVDDHIRESAGEFWNERWLEKQTLILEGEKLGYLFDHYGGYYSWEPDESNYVRCDPHYHYTNFKDTTSSSSTASVIALMPICIYKRLLYESLVKQGNPEDAEMLLKKDDKYVDDVFENYDISVSSDQAYLIEPSVIFGHLA